MTPILRRPRPTCLLTACLLATLLAAAPKAVSASAAEVAAAAPPDASAWARRLGHTSREYATAVAVDAAGNVFLAGFFLGHTEMVEGSRLAGTGDADAFVAKLDPQGHPLWARRFGGALQDEAKGLALAPDGGVYVGGFFTTRAQTDDRALTLTSAGGADAFVLRLDADGKILWGRALGGELADAGYDLATAGTGVYLTGSFQRRVELETPAGTTQLVSAGATDAFVARLDDAGKISWARGLGGPRADVGRAVAAGGVADGGWVAVAGTFTGESELPGFGGQGRTLVSAGGSDVFVARWSTGGEPRWAVRLGGAASDSVEALAGSRDGDLYLAGQFTGTLEVAGTGGPLRLASDGGLDAFAVRFDGQGRARWARRLGGTGNELAFGVAAAEGGDLWITGFELPGAAPGGTATTETRSFVARLDGEGAVRQQSLLEASSGIQSFALALGPDGARYVAGAFKGEATCPLGGRTATLKAAGKVDAFVARLAAE